jgi:hypothetical protein
MALPSARITPLLFAIAIHEEESELLAAVESNGGPSDGWTQNDEAYVVTGLVTL